MFRPDAKTKQLIEWLQAGRGAELIRGIPPEVQDLWSRRDEHPLLLDADAQARLHDGVPAEIVAPVMIESARAALADIEEHQEHSELADDEEDIKELLRRWQQHAATVVSDAPSPAPAAKLLDDRDSGVGQISFGRFARAVIEEEEKPRLAELNSASDRSALAAVVADIGQGPEPSALLGEAMCASVDHKLFYTESTNDKEQFAACHALIEAFALFVKAHGLPPFYGQSAVASACGVVWQSRDAPCDALLREQLLPTTPPGKRLFFNVAKLHAAMERKGELLGAIEGALVCGYHPIDFGWAPFCEWRDDADVARLLGDSWRPVAV